MKYRFVATAIAVAIIAISGCKEDKTSEATAAAAPETTAAAEPTTPEPPAEVTYCGGAPCPCEPGTEKTHHGSDELRQCKLARPFEIQGYPVRDGGEINFTSAGKLHRFDLGQDFEVGGYPARPTRVELFADGKVKSIQLREPTEIDGITCTDGVSFFKTGTLRRCELAAEAELSGHKAQPGDFVTLDQDGTLHRWEVGKRTQTIGAYECSGYLNYLHPTGELLRCGFAKPVKIEGTNYKAGDLVCFGTDGKVTDCAGFTFDVGAG